MRNIFNSCKNLNSENTSLNHGIYICIEDIILLIVSVILLFIFTKAIKIIFKDRNNYLDKMDKLIFCNAYLQVICLFLYFFLFSNLFFLSTIRSSRIIQELFICLIFIYIAIEESSSSEKLMRIVLGLIVVIIFIWFCGAILMKSTIDWICGSKILLVFSTELIMINAVTLYFGINSIEKIKQNTPDVSSGYLASIYGLMTVGFVTAIVQFLYDYLTHIRSKKIEDCFNWYLPQNVFKFVLLILWKFCTMFVPPIAIYLLFYYKNRSKFNITPENKRRLSVFDENRSQENIDESDQN